MIGAELDLATGQVTFFDDVKPRLDLVRSAPRE